MMRATLLLTLIACAADARSPDPREPGDPSHPMDPGHPGPTHGASLTASAPRQEVAIAAPAGAPSTLTLTITAIDNPGSQGFSLAASAVWTGGGASVEEVIGAVTPYPSNVGGSYALGVPDAARKVLSRTGGQLGLRLSLQPISADRALSEPLRVTLGDPAWR
jgi:hypothetical protein